jgi:molybdopterin molybdotransferase
MSSPDEARELPGRLPVESARQQVLAGAEPLDPVEVPLARVSGRVTAEHAVTPADVPPFDSSAMDGFAVRAADCPPEGGGDGGGAGVVLQMVGESSAGTPWTGSLEPGGAVSISTGAEVPPGADAVVKVEDTTRRDGAVVVGSATRTGQNIRRRGEAMTAGSEVLPAGSRIGPVELGLLASTGNDPVLCRPRPTVAIIATGDELVAPGIPLGPGQIWNSNLPVISAMARAAGGSVASAATIGDTTAETEAALGTALESNLTVICGGVSVGEHDHVKATLASLGVERLFWGLAMKPGRPAWFGRRGNSRVLGLPGNPVSAMAVFAILGAPLLKALSGDRSADEVGRGRLLSPVGRLSDRLLAVPCRLEQGSAATGLEPIAIKGSHDFISLAGARALALVEPGEGDAEAGEEVRMIALVGE